MRFKVISNKLVAGRPQIHIYSELPPEGRILARRAGSGRRVFLANLGDFWS